MESQTKPKEAEASNDQKGASDDASSNSDFNLIEPVQDDRMIAFYNNNGSKTNLMSQESQPQSYLQSLLINTKYKIDS